MKYNVALRIPCQRFYDGKKNSNKDGGLYIHGNTCLVGLVMMNTGGIINYHGECSLLVGTGSSCQTCPALPIPVCLV